MPDHGRPPRVFISYSHDSQEHVYAVHSLSEQLRREGVDCQIDAYVRFSPPEGWPQWMEEQIQIADYVLVVCTETYLRRVTGKEADGVGLGATWEGAIITQSLYESQGRNEKFIPVVLDDSDIAHIPTWIRSATRYNPTTQSGYDDLYRHLTSQPKVAVPQLGEMREMPPEEAGSSATQVFESPDYESLVLLQSPEGKFQVINSDTITLSDRLTIVFAPASQEQTAYLATFRNVRDPVGLANGTTAMLARVTDVTQERAGATEKWKFEFAPEETDYGAGPFEMSTSSMSADEIAERRARRILLGEKEPTTGDGTPAMVNDAFREVLYRGLGTPVQVQQSPLPDLFAKVDEPDAFLAIAKLVSVLLLRLSGVVETISRLQMNLEGSLLTVDFVGQRSRKYANRNPAVVAVSGSADLAG